MSTCHLHELIEKFDKDDICAPSGYKNINGVVEFLNVADVAARDAVCFYVGGEESTPDVDLVPGLVRLPFPVCWFEFELVGCAYATCGVLATATTWFVFGRTNNPLQWDFCGVGVREGVGESDLRWNIFPNICGPYVDFVSSFLTLTAIFLTALNCSNVRQVEHLPDEKLKRARKKRGKLPLFSFWTLELDLTKGRSNAHGDGTHASPRVHLRRGHARQYAPGKWTWVQPCAVGSVAAGIVHKEYALKPGGVQ